MHGSFFKKKTKHQTEILFLRPDWWSLVAERFYLLSRRQYGGCDMPTLEIGADMEFRSNVASVLSFL